MSVPRVAGGGAPAGRAGELSVITAIIPAHDEASRVACAIASLHRQTCPPERVVVMSDHSTDATVEVALQAGAEVLLTVDNRHHEAGALDQALSAVRFGPDDLVLVLDADVQLPPSFLARARTALEDRNMGAVSARRTTGGAAALIRWRALEDVHHAFGRYCGEGPVVTGRMHLALDLEAVGWRLCPPLGTDVDAPIPATIRPVETAAA